MRRPKIDKLEDCLTSIDTLDNKAYFQLLDLKLYVDRLERKTSKLDLSHIDNILKYRDKKPNYQEKPGRLVDNEDINTDNNIDSTVYIDTFIDDDDDDDEISNHAQYIGAPGGEQ